MVKHVSDGQKAFILMGRQGETWRWCATLRDVAVFSPELMWVRLKVHCVQFSLHTGITSLWDVSRIVVVTILISWWWLTWFIGFSSGFLDVFLTETFFSVYDLILSFQTRTQDSWSNRLLEKSVILCWSLCTPRPLSEVHATDLL